MKYSSSFSFPHTLRLSHPLLNTSLSFFFLNNGADEDCMLRDRAGGLGDGQGYCAGVSRLQATGKESEKDNKSSC